MPRNNRILCRFYVVLLFIVFVGLLPLSARGQFRDVTSPESEPLTVDSTLDSDELPLTVVDDARIDVETVQSGQENASGASVPVDGPPSASDDGTENDESANEEHQTDDQAIRPIKFNGIAAGITSASDLKQKWGKPAKELKKANHTLWKYRVKPFRQVDVTLVEDSVDSMLLYLEQPLEPIDVAEELGLIDFMPVPIPDEDGRVLGQGYPERGVLLSFTDDQESPLVTRIRLEPITSELFTLRAEYDFQRRCQSNLEDVNLAIQLDSGNARAHWWKAIVLERVGQYQSALVAAEKAVELEPSSNHFRLVRARLLATNGKHSAGLRETEEVSRVEGLSPEIRALAKCQLGDLIASGPDGKLKEAMRHHLEAIKLAASQASDHRFLVRRLAKDVLLKSHLGVAMDIARGDFQRKEEVIPKWIERAAAIAEESITRDQGDKIDRLRVLQTKLAASVYLNGVFTEVDTADEAVELGRNLIAAESDRLTQSRYEWELGHLLFEAMRVARLRDEHDRALRYADNAMSLLEQSAPKRQSTPEQKYLVARLYFLLGTLHAVHLSDHAEAVVWYKKAEPLLRGTLPVSSADEMGILGERFVSMGVSHWEVGSRQKAIQLTKHGMEIMQNAVKGGKLTGDALAVPYGNLATMHRDVGNATQAQEYSQLASKASAGTSDRTIRR